MKKELFPGNEPASCDVCGRTILKGERTEPYLVPDGSRRLVCDLCLRRAEGAGWIRESASEMMPTTLPRSEPRRSLLGRLRGRAGEAARSAADAGPRRGVAAPEPASGWQLEEHDYARNGDAETEQALETLDEAAPSEELEPPSEDVEWVEHPVEAGEDLEPAAPAGPASELLEHESAAAREAGAREERRRRRIRDPRHVRAIPTSPDARVERALELFGVSEHRRTVAGLQRTLGDPWVHALADLGSSSQVTVVVAWELSWYRYRIDLGDAAEPVSLVEKGQEIDELDPHLREWNGGARPDGILVRGTGE